MVDNIQKYIPISKIDEEQKMVYGYASTPDLDSQGEVVDTNAIKNALPEYLKFPTIREMHQPNPVGTTKSTVVDEKGLYIGAKIVDDNAWKKVKEGVFRGFSIGGRVKNMVDNMITALDLTEISLVDVPANKNAVITLFKKGESSYKDEYLSLLAKFNFEIREGVSSMAKKKDKNEEEVVETVDEVETEEDTVDAQEEPVESTETDEVEETEEADEADEEEETEEVEAPVEESTDGVVVDEAKQVSDEPSDLTKALAKLDDMEKAYEKSAEKMDSLAKLDEAIVKVVSHLERLEERIAKVEGVPAETKTKATYLVEKGLGVAEPVDVSPELAKAEGELAELIKVRETDPERYGREKMSDRAFKLMDKINALR